VPRRAYVLKLAGARDGVRVEGGQEQHGGVALSNFDGFTNDPEWETWDVKAAVNTWLGTPTSNHGLLLKMRNESLPFVSPANADIDIDRCCGGRRSLPAPRLRSPLLSTALAAWPALGGIAPIPCAKP
jgi:hypothetical protein